ncbi:hypothetical protein GQ600_1969 [Phytophthora cactorum]|nr:hypothetical protein GQ600_1969 [Phytophthora cactorum]
MPSRQSPSSQRTPPVRCPVLLRVRIQRSSRRHGFIEVVAPKLHEEWVASQLDDSSMRALVTSGYTFQNFTCALYATDVAFQQGIAPSGSKAEAMPFYSANTSCMGLKLKYLSTRERGNTADITVFATTKHSTNLLAVKLTVITFLLTMVLWRQTIRRNGRFWRTKDIKVSETMIAAFTPKRAINSPRRSTRNELISSDRVIVENLLGRCAVYGAFVRSNSAGVNRFMTISSKYT